MSKSLTENLPHRRMEAWKWTDVRRAVSDTQSGMMSVCVPELQLSSGLSVTRETIKPTGTPMGKLAAQFGGEAYVIDVPERHDGSVDIGSLRNGHARIVLRVGKNAKLSVCEEHGGADGFVNLDIRFELEQGAQLTRTLVHDGDSESATRIITANINAWQGAEIMQHALSFGAGLSRFETRIASLGADLKADIHGAYLLNEKRHCDMTSYIDLGAENARVRQSVKGVVTDKARGVFQGKFHVRRPAQYTDAEMRHDAIMLSDSCEVRAKPELEIYADDVACAHGNTVGALDESALFYMRQRGIPARQARALLTQAFVAQSFDSMSDDTDFMAKVMDWLEHNS